MKIHSKFDRLICGLVQNKTCDEDERNLSDWITAGKPVVLEADTCRHGTPTSVNGCGECLSEGMLIATQARRIEELEAEVKRLRGLKR